mmetsp:Transcript_17283/g.70176  ORF Transcript_17283/g.70176 Transcript_17283/m.70176 type:complete len:80 (-) Transcript_17283:1761-2000(-)
MFVTIASNTEDPRRLEVHEDMEIEILRELVSVEVSRFASPFDRALVLFRGLLKDFLFCSFPGRCLVPLCLSVSVFDPRR